MSNEVSKIANSPSPKSTPLASAENVPAPPPPTDSSPLTANAVLPVSSTPGGSGGTPTQAVNGSPDTTQTGPAYTDSEAALLAKIGYPVTPASQDIAFKDLLKKSDPTWTTSPDQLVDSDFDPSGFVTKYKDTPAEADALTLATTVDHQREMAPTSSKIGGFIGNGLIGTGKLIGKGLGAAYDAATTNPLTTLSNIGSGISSMVSPFIIAGKDMMIPGGTEAYLSGMVNGAGTQSAILNGVNALPQSLQDAANNSGYTKTLRESAAIGATAGENNAATVYGAGMGLRSLASPWIGPRSRDQVAADIDTVANLRYQAKLDAAGNPETNNAETLDPEAAKQRLATAIATAPDPDTVNSTAQLSDIKNIALLAGTEGIAGALAPSIKALGEAMMPDSFIPPLTTGLVKGYENVIQHSAGLAGLGAGEAAGAAMGIPPGIAFFSTGGIGLAKGEAMGAKLAANPNIIKGMHMIYQGIPMVFNGVKWVAATAMTQAPEVIGGAAGGLALGAAGTLGSDESNEQKQEDIANAGVLGASVGGIGKVTKEVGEGYAQGPQIAKDTARFGAGNVVDVDPVTGEEIKSTPLNKVGQFAYKATHGTPEASVPPTTPVTSASSSAAAPLALAETTQSAPIPAGYTRPPSLVEKSTPPEIGESLGNLTPEEIAANTASGQPDWVTNPHPFKAPPPAKVIHMGDTEGIPGETPPEATPVHPLDPLIEQAKMNFQKLQEEAAVQQKTLDTHLSTDPSTYQSPAVSLNYNKMLKSYQQWVNDANAKVTDAANRVYDLEAMKNPPKEPISQEVSTSKSSEGTPAKEEKSPAIVDAFPQAAAPAPEPKNFSTLSQVTPTREYATIPPEKEQTLSPKHERQQLSPKTGTTPAGEWASPTNKIPKMSSDPIWHQIVSTSHPDVRAAMQEFIDKYENTYHGKRILAKYNEAEHDLALKRSGDVRAQEYRDANNDLTQRTLEDKTMYPTGLYTQESAIPRYDNEAFKRAFNDLSLLAKQKGSDPAFIQKVQADLAHIESSKNKPVPTRLKAARTDEAKKVREKALSFLPKETKGYMTAFSDQKAADNIRELSGDFSKLAQQPNANPLYAQMAQYLNSSEFLADAKIRANNLWTGHTAAGGKFLKPGETVTPEGKFHSTLKKEAAENPTSGGAYPIKPSHGLDSGLKVQLHELVQGRTGSITDKSGVNVPEGIVNDVSKKTLTGIGKNPLEKQFVSDMQNLEPGFDISHRLQSTHMAIRLDRMHKTNLASGAEKYPLSPYSNGHTFLGKDLPREDQIALEHASAIAQGDTTTADALKAEALGLKPTTH